MNCQTTPTVDAIGQMHFEGNITPIEWYNHIQFSDSKADTIAIAILADIVYWYRPTIVRDERTGLPIGNKKKFKADLLQKSYQQYADLFHVTKLQVTRAIERLEKLGLIRRVFRSISVPSGILSNVLFIELIPDALKAITIRADSYPSIPQVDIYPPDSEELSTLKSIATHFELGTYTENTTENTTEIRESFSEGEALETPPPKGEGSPALTP